MFVAARAVAYATLFIGLFLVFVPVRVLRSAGDLMTPATGVWQGRHIGWRGRRRARPRLHRHVCRRRRRDARAYEEPTLRKPFGLEYEHYCDRVARWRPRWPD